MRDAVVAIVHLGKRILGSNLLLLPYRLSGAICCSFHLMRHCLHDVSTCVLSGHYDDDYDDNDDNGDDDDKDAGDGRRRDARS